MKRTSKAEVLAPAGTFDAFRAAINAGADAVYLGGNMFGARAFAGNFDEQELIRAIDIAHLHNRKIYLTVNTLLRDEEIDKLAAFIKPYYEAGLDAAIVQDYGAFSLLREHFPQLSLHASTQMTITGRYGAQLLKDMGAARVVTARELTLAEIKNIHDNVDVEIESFVHGALCYSYSGQCLLSSMIGGRSGNRGRCAQPCRLKYSCMNRQNSNLLSPKDMCTLEIIPDIIEAGVYSLKIEGRMKSPEYVAGVVSAYRKYVDTYFEKGRDGFKVDKEDLKKLMDVYNRGGFCKGYYFKHNDREMMTFDRPNHQGILVGTVKNNNIVLSEKVNTGDVLELSTDAEFTVSGSWNAGQMIKIPFIKGYKPVNGQEVFRTRNDSLLSELHERYVENNKKIPIKMSVVLISGQNAMLTVSAAKGCDDIGEVSFTGDVLEQSQNHPAARQDVIKQLVKLGDTPFSCEASDIEVELSDNTFVPVKLLNTLRRECVEKYEHEILNRFKRTSEDINSECIAGKMHERISGNIPESGKKYKTSNTVLIMTEEQLNIVLKCFKEGSFVVDRIYLATELAGVSGAIDMCRKIKNVFSFNMSADDNLFSDSMDRCEVYLVMPYIFRDKASGIFTSRLEDIIDAGFDGVLVRSPEEIEFVKSTGIYEAVSGNIMADYDTYTYNSEAVKEYKRLGINEFTLSEELNEKQLAGLCRNIKNIQDFESCGNGADSSVNLAADDVYIEKIVYGHIPLMITAGCTKAYLSKDKPCGKSSIYNISDRKNKSMPTVNCCHYCYNMIYNYAPLCLFDRTEQLKKMKVNGLRLMFTVENGSETEAVIRQFVLGENKMSEFTRGHYNRGVD